MICYYFIGLPLALSLAFKREMGVRGLWLGFSVACIVLDIGLEMIIECADWQKISVDMHKKIDKDHKQKIECTPSSSLRREDYAAKGLGQTPESKRFIM